MKCFVWSVALHGAETWTLRRNEQKRLEAFGMWIWRRMVRIKWIEKIKNGKKSRRRKTNAGTDKEIEKKLTGQLAKKKLPALEGMVNGKKVHGRRRYQMTDNIMINALYADTKRKAEKRVQLENAEPAVKTLLLGRTLRLIDSRLINYFVHNVFFLNKQIYF